MLISQAFGFFDCKKRYHKAEARVAFHNCWLNMLVIYAAVCYNATAGQIEKAAHCASEKKTKNAAKPKFYAIPLDKFMQMNYNSSRR